MSELDAVICSHLHAWARHGTVDLKEVTSNMLFDYAAKQLMSYDELKTPLKLAENFKAFIYGLLSFPLDIPGTAYHACLQGRKNATKIITDIYNDRKASKIRRGDFLDHLLEEVESEKSFLNESAAIDLVLVLLFAYHETTSTCWLN
ncbi:cytochrome P450 87A3-like [Juglans regia]|nr:cytochrome P450 87A3-like [Juglans regia]